MTQASASVPASDVFAVIVTYQPDLLLLGRLLDALLPQVGGAVIVDNGSRADVAAWVAQRPDARLGVQSLGANLGIAYAQNRGIEWARRAGAGFVLLSDQDSQPAADMVARLHEAALSLQAQGHRVGAVGPQYMDARHGPSSPFVRIRGLWLERPTEADARADGTVAVDYLIASGCLVPMPALAAVGGMHEAMFIDYVDVEWGLRARGLGWLSFGSFRAHMQHQLGDSEVYFAGRSRTIHSALRHYYAMRNGLWMCGQPHVPLAWKFVDGSKLLARLFFYTAVSRPWREHLAMMLRGLADGLRGRLGPYRPR